MGPKDFSLMAQILQPINQASHSCTVQFVLGLGVTLGKEVVELMQNQW